MSEIPKSSFRGVDLNNKETSEAKVLCGSSTRNIWLQSNQIQTNEVQVEAAAAAAAAAAEKGDTVINNHSTNKVGASFA